MYKLSYSPSDSVGRKALLLFGDNEKILKKELKNDFIQYKSPLFVVDKNLPSQYLKIAKIITNLQSGNILELNPDNKNLEKMTILWQEMVEKVPDILVSIGGGTIGDLTGFASGTYQRGIPRIYFPTTVLSMVDASIGGKSAMDFGSVKNSIGVIQYPIYSISYIPFLKTLPKEEYTSGFAEIIKAAVLYDKKFFDNLYSYALINDMTRKNFSDRTLEIFYTSAKLKAKICETPNNKKITLLYGHAIGHALEKISTVRMRHGDCVAIGMNIEGALSCYLGLWKMEEWKKQLLLIKKFLLPTSIPDNVSIQILVNQMQFYKKLVDSENFLFSLPKQIGTINNSETTYLTAVKKMEMVSVIKKTITWINNNYV